MYPSQPPLLQTQYDALKKQMEVMEMEVMEARLIRAAEINGEVDDDDAGGSDTQELSSGLSEEPRYPALGSRAPCPGLSPL